MKFFSLERDVISEGINSTVKCIVKKVYIVITVKWLLLG
jgi:hypothetical protein